MDIKAGWRTHRNTWMPTLLGAGLSVFGCECGSGGPGLTRLRAKMVVFDPAVLGTPEITELDFGAVPLGSRNLRPLGIRNEGDTGLRICVAGTQDTRCSEVSRLLPDTGPFSVAFGALSEDGVLIVEREVARELSLGFQPSAVGSESATLVLVHDGSNGPTTHINVKGTGVEPRIDVSATDLDFGEVTVGQRGELELELRNPSPFAQPFRVDPIAQSAVIFGATPPSAEVPAGGSTTIVVWFQPVESGPTENAVVIRYCDTCAKPVRVHGVGVKPVFELDPPSLDFGSSDLGGLARRSFVVRNTGNVSLTVESVGLERGTTSEFSVGGTLALPAVLQPAQELHVAVTYAGVNVGDDAGNVEVVTNAWDDPNTPISETVGLVALLANTRGPEIDPFPTAVNFGTTAILATRVRILAIQNVGNAPLDIDNIGLETTTGEITLVTPPATPLVLAPGTSVDLRLSYTPTDTGFDGGTVVVTSNDGDEGTLLVPLSGFGGQPTTCSLEVAPSQLTFGLVERGRVATLPLELRNSGTSCTVSNVRLSGDPEFAISTGAPAGTITIPPGGTHRIDVQYAPTAYGNNTTLLQFESDDPAQMTAQIPIAGASDQSFLVVIPSALDFGVVPIGCRSASRTVTVYNTGSSPVQLNNIFLDPSTSAELELTSTATPRTLGAGASIVIQLTYHPANVGQDAGALFISHSANVVPTVVPLIGEGAVAPTETEIFNQTASERADVLFVVDNSGSMEEEQALLGTNLAAFLAFAQAQGIDYQIAVTTTDVRSRGEHGRFVGTPPIITPATANAENVFLQIVTGLGTNGSGDEQGLEASYLALSDPLINTWNAGFLRADAALAVIYVSDEIDHSPNPPAFYESFLLNIKGFANTTLFSASAVVGLTDPECTGPGGSAEYAPNYISVADDTGGVTEEICLADWGQALTNIGLNSFGLRRQFPLSSQPDPTTIVVTVDGVAAPASGWSYDANTNSVVFSAAPAEGSTIQVAYGVDCLP